MNNNVLILGIVIGSIAAIAPSVNAQSIPTSVNTAPCGDANIQTTYDTKSKKYHKYSVKNKICSNKNNRCCTRESIFFIMKSQKQFIAPTDLKEPVQHCGVTILTNKVSRYDPIKTFIDENDYSITNYTLPEHIFHPGYIIRKVVENEDNISIETTGEGVGNLKIINNYKAPGIWNKVDENLRKQVSSSLSGERCFRVGTDVKPNQSKNRNQNKKPKPIDMEINGPDGSLKDLLEQIRRGK